MNPRAREGRIYAPHRRFACLGVVGSIPLSTESRDICSILKIGVLRGQGEGRKEGCSEVLVGGEKLAGLGVNAGLGMNSGLGMNAGLGADSGLGMKLY